MKTTIVALTIALSGAACAGSNPQPADPSSAAAERTTPVAESTTTSSSPSPSWNPNPTTTTTSATTQAATPLPSTTTPASTAETPAASTGATSMMGNDHTGTADNTRVNARDRNGATTPVQQGNSASELGITASIRKGVMRDGTLSFTAKNVKIITVGTKVTLRGAVKTDAERTTIENLARQTAGVTDVDDEIEVK